jgi:hypothetical protein
MFDQQTITAARAHATAIGVEPAALLAVIELESAGVVTARIGDRDEPLIRFEGHYFDRRLKGAALERARREGLADPRAGAVTNPSTQIARWRLLNRAIEIDAVAALESCSWGVGQVMGAHWQWLGYDRVEKLVNTARSGVAGQIGLMALYILKADLAGALRRRDWAAFARGYNGPGFAKNGYHTKLAAAYRRHSGGVSAPAPSAKGMLRLGSAGARVRELQALLVRAGHPVRVDGDYGPATHSAVMEFQKIAGLEVDGVAGPQTLRALDRFRQGAADSPGAQAALEVKEVRDGLAGGLGGGLATEVARQHVETAADRLAFVPGLEWLSAGLTVAAVVLVVGGLAWAAHGWWKSRRTVEAPDEPHAPPEPDWAA